jgi:hypothetical protein
MPKTYPMFHYSMISKSVEVHILDWVLGVFLRDFIN